MRETPARRRPRRGSESRSGLGGLGLGLAFTRLAPVALIVRMVARDAGGCGQIPDDPQIALVRRPDGTREPHALDRPLCVVVRRIQAALESRLLAHHVTR